MAAPAVVRVGVACFVSPKDRPNVVLMGRRKSSHGAGRLATPGGHLELGESWEECARREIMEEANLTLENVRFAGVTNDPSIGGDFNKHYITIFMRGEVSDNSGPLENLEPHKCESWDWIEWNDLREIANSTPERLFDPVIHLLESGFQLNA